MNNFYFLLVFIEGWTGVGTPSITSEMSKESRLKLLLFPSGLFIRGAGVMWVLRYMVDNPEVTSSQP